MNSFQSRLNEALGKSGISKAELSRRTGIGRNSITDYSKGKYDAKQDNVYLIAKALNVSPSWLMGYNVPVNKQQELIDIFNKLKPDNQDKVFNFAERRLDEQNNIIKYPDHINKDDSNTVLNYGYVSAGTGEYMIDNQPEEITVHGGIPADYDFAVTINGDSMEPMFADGQVIFVRSTVEAISGQIVIAELNGDAYVKKLQADESSCRLVSLNSKYKPINIDEDDDFKVVGVVVL